MGKFLIFCQIQLKFGFRLYKKRWHTSWKFQLEKTSNKKVIAKKPMTNLYEMNSSIATFESFRRTQKTIDEEFPIDSHCKNHPLSARFWRCWKRAIFTIGVYGEIICPLTDLYEFSPKSLSKTFKWSRWVDWARCYINIAENLFALGHETDSSNVLYWAINLK